MSVIKFNLIIANGMCRITAKDIRREVRELSDGGCICSLDVLMDEMKEIVMDTKKIFNDEDVQVAFIPLIIND